MSIASIIKTSSHLLKVLVTAGILGIEQRKYSRNSRNSLVKSMESVPVAHCCFVPNDQFALLEEVSHSGSFGDVTRDMVGG